MADLDVTNFDYNPSPIYEVSRSEMDFGDGFDFVAYIEPAPPPEVSYASKLNQGTN